MSATLDALAAENRELRRELNHARERLDGVLTSRWWRLHPRRLLGGVDVGRGHAFEDNRRAALVLPRPAASTLPGQDASHERFLHDVVARGSFSEDWVSQRFSPWAPIFSELEDSPVRILEIGSFEGLSACFFLWRLPRANVTCVDPFEDVTAAVLERAGTRTRDLEAIFDSNVALVDASRVRKLVGDSKRRLLDLAADGAQFDLVYVDGSHLGLDVLVDAALAWNILALQGVIVFDDYRFDYLGQDPLLRPGKAIDVFRELVAGKHEALFSNGQVALRRII